jgi:hypothetical protein
VRHGPLSRTASISTATILESLPPSPLSDPLLHRISCMYTPDAPSNVFKSMSFLTDLQSLCHQVKLIMIKETRVLHLTSPIYCFGDIHGNISDLNFFRDHCWPLGNVYFTFINLSQL